MFDKTFITPVQKEYIEKSSFITVTEKKAPTDESVKLLREMEKEALNKLISAFEVKNNVFSGKIFFFARIDMRCNFRIKYMINNKEVQVDGSINDVERIMKSKDEIIKLFFTEVSESLTRKLLMDNSSLELIQKNL